MTSQLVLPTDGSIWRVPRSQAHKLRVLRTSSRCSQALKGPGSEECFRTAINASCKRKSLSTLICHQARWQPSPERKNRAREAHKMFFARGQTILMSQILGSRQGVEKGEAVSERDVDLVVVEAPEVVVDHLVTAFLHIALNLAALRIWNLHLPFLQSRRILWERPHDDGRPQLRYL